MLNISESKIEVALFTPNANRIVDAINSTLANSTELGNIVETCAIYGAGNGGNMTRKLAHYGDYIYAFVDPIIDLTIWMKL